MLFEYKLREAAEEAYAKAYKKAFAKEYKKAIAQGKTEDRVSMAEKMLRRDYPDGEILAIIGDLKQEDLEKLRRKIRLE